MGNSMLAYHHETSLILPFVVADEASWPQPSNAMPRTLLWFTMNTQVDSAQIDSERSGNQGTLIRFACPTSLLLPWQKAALPAGWRTERIEEKDAAGDRRGVHLRDWLATS